MIEVKINRDRVWAVHAYKSYLINRIYYNKIVEGNYGNAACIMHKSSSGRLGVGESTSYWGPWCFFLGVF